MFDRTTIMAIARQARIAKLPFAHVAAIVETESAGSIGTIVRGKMRPVIRYEGHYFDKRCADMVRAAARKAGVSNPKAGGVKNPSSQTARYDLVDRAAAFDRQAAYESVSWGVGQVMGAHWKRLKYASILDLVHRAEAGVEGQVDLMLRFIIADPKLFRALKEGNWPVVANGYNGAGYKANAYDVKMAKSAKKWAAYERDHPGLADRHAVAVPPAAAPEVKKLIEATDGSAVSTTNIAAGIGSVSGAVAIGNEAAYAVSSAKDSLDMLLAAGPWLLLLIVCLGAGWWIWRERQAKRALGAAAREAVK